MGAGKTRDDRAAVWLLKLLEDENPSLQETAEAALIDLGSAAVKPLLEVLKKERQSKQE